MSTTHHMSSRRPIVAALLTIAALALALASVTGITGTAPEGVEEDEDELVGIAGVQRIVVNPEGTIEAAFARESYRPGETAELRLFGDVGRLTIRLFHSGPEGIRTRRNDLMFGVEVAPRRVVASARRGSVVRVHVGNWPSGLYFARLSARGERLGFAPFVVAPRRLGEHPVAIVMPTNTWSAYNVRDGDRDGVGDSWYADQRHVTIETSRPFLSRGVPFRFRFYDLPFLRWLDRTGKRVDVLSDLDLHRTTAERLAKAYRLIVFPGHHEYVTEEEYDAIEGYRDRGGNLAFLSANNFFWKVTRHDGRLTRIRQWRDLGRPESALIGVQYIGNDDGEARGAWIVRRTPDTRWLFARTGKRPGERLSNGGIEIDATSPSSPKGTIVVAEIPNLLGRGMTAQMTYYETRRGARVFAAGAFTLAGAVFQPDVKALMENVWRELGAGRETVSRP
jgi:hypothetical protein